MANQRGKRNREDAVATKRCSLLAVMLLGFIALTAAANPKKKPIRAATDETSRKAPAPAPQPNDDEYTAKIREYTTEKYFTTEFVDHLPGLRHGSDA